MKHYHPLTVQSIAQETQDTVCVSFAVPEELADTYNYLQGQHVGLRKKFDDQDIRRSYSIASSVQDGRLDIAVRKVEGGIFSTFINNDLKVGDTLDVFPPVGTFRTELEPSAERTYVAFAAGSGITPIYSIIKTTLEAEPESRFVLFFGNRNGRSIIFRNRLTDLKNQFMGRLSVYHFLSQEENDIELFNGRLDGKKVKDLLGRIVPVDAIDEAYVCGPGTMIEEVTAALVEEGVEPSRIHHEHFGVTDAAAKNAAPRAKNAKTGQVNLTVIRDGESFNLQVQQTDKPLLDEIADGGIDVPYSCKGGVCCTCRAKVVKGKAEMVLNYGLEEDDVKKGFILTCQSYPVSDNLILDFDA
ncbi:1,2-phenylacetyl-CoA epoxidase subunit PaaE [Kordiimonas lipolytica]|uniref:1,2-phenylacetyl-CoA epoxidase subunit PaaE n=1 Tax=Kordiimonas lipolytica TaxID=1662421 RepID=A0ABV8UCF4_9PROT|nr:1,2-phenylacetyl-CoA epoxidase subunit PaaE [Kordiimonas lipolytica]